MPKASPTPLLAITGTVCAIGDMDAEALAAVQPCRPGAVLSLADGRNLLIVGLLNEEALALGAAFMAGPVRVEVSLEPGEPHAN